MVLGDNCSVVRHIRGVTLGCSGGAAGCDVEEAAGAFAAVVDAAYDVTVDVGTSCVEEAAAASHEATAVEAMDAAAAAVVDATWPAAEHCTGSIQEEWDDERDSFQKGWAVTAEVWTDVAPGTR